MQRNRAYQAPWVNHLDEDQRKLLEEWKGLTRGVPTHVVVRAMNCTRPGIEWAGCTKTHMGGTFCGVPTFNYPFTEDQRTTFRKALQSPYEPRRRKLSEFQQILNYIQVKIDLGGKGAEVLAQLKASLEAGEHCKAEEATNGGEGHT